MLYVGNPIKWKLCAKFPDLDKSSSGKLLVGNGHTFYHATCCQIVLCGNGKWEMGNVNNLDSLWEMPGSGLPEHVGGDNNPAQRLCAPFWPGP